MNNIWYDKLHPNQMRKRDKLGIFLGFITFGIVAPVTVSFRENEQVVFNITNVSYLIEFCQFFLGNNWWKSETKVCRWRNIVCMSLCFSLRSCGINYCDPFALEYPRISRSNLGINQFFHRLKNFHQSLLMKFCYHFVCVSHCLSRAKIRIQCISDHLSLLPLTLLLCSSIPI